MKMIEYQNAARKTAIYPDIGRNIYYPVLGLCGEAGEVAEKIKKIMRDNHGFIGKKERDSLKAELGDVLWYVANLATELQISMNDIAKENLEKLQSRQERGTLKGNGDER